MLNTIVPVGLHFFPGRNLEWPHEAHCEERWHRQGTKYSWAAEDPAVPTCHTASLFLTLTVGRPAPTA